MRRLSFIITITGIFILLIILTNSKPIEVNSPEEIESLYQNQKIFIQGKVISQTSSSIKLDNNIIISCRNCPTYTNKNVTVIGYFDSYFNKIKALKIKNDA